MANWIGRQLLLLEKFSDFIPVYSVIASTHDIYKGTSLALPASMSCSSKKPGRTSKAY